MTELIDTRRGRRKAKFAALLTLAATVGALIVLPATGASAMAIDCSYGGPGLKSYIGDGREGVTCAGSGTGSGSGVGFHSVTTPGDGQLVPSGLCPAGTIPPVVPDDFYDHGYISTNTYTRDLEADPGRPITTDTVTAYYRLGRLVAIRDIFMNSSGDVRQIAFQDFTLKDESGAGVILRSIGSCTGGWSATSDPSESAPYKILPDNPMALPGTPIPTTAPHEVLTMGSLMAVPFSSGKYFLRIDVTNNDDVNRSADVDIDLSAYSLSTVAALPRDGSCPYASNADEHCAVGSLAPGDSKTLLLVVQAKPDAAASAPLQIMTEFPGYDLLGIRYLEHEVARPSYVAPPTP
jgi:hypothetical protein